MHNQRFFSYLSLFTFMMIILVTANNYLLMFVGWEGNHNSLKWLNLNKFNIVYSFIKNKSSVNNINNNCLLIGSLLGNSYLEKNEKGVRIVFIKCNDNIEYLIQFYNTFRDIIVGKNKPNLKKVISKNNKILYYWEAETYYLSSFKWLYEMFYKNDLKTMPLNLNEYLTPKALATWYLDNTDKIFLSNKQSFYLNIDSIEYILKLLQNKYNLNTDYKLESKGKVVFYVEKNSLDCFKKTIKSFFSSSLTHKLNNPYQKLSMWNNTLNKNLNKRYYSSMAKDIKYSIKYKNEYIIRGNNKKILYTSNKKNKKNAKHDEQMTLAVSNEAWRPISRLRMYGLSFCASWARPLLNNVSLVLALVLPVIAEVANSILALQGGTKLTQSTSHCPQLPFPLYCWLKFLSWVSPIKIGLATSLKLSSSYSSYSPLTSCHAALLVLLLPL